MAKRRSKKQETEQTSTGLVPTGEPPAMDEADGVRVGEEPVPGMRLRCICCGHEGTIGRIAWSPCGRFIASPSVDKTIRIWDAKNGKCLAVLEGHQNVVTSVAWSPNGELLASGAKDEEVVLWNCKTKEIVRKLRASKANAHCLTWCYDGRLASVVGSTRAAIWKPESTLPTISITGHVVALNSLAISPDGTTIATGGTLTVRLWSSQTGTSEPELDSVSEHVLCLLWSRDGKLLIWPDSEYGLRIYEVKRSNLVARLEGHTGTVTSLSISHDGRVLASKSDDGSFRLWDLKSLEPIRTLGEEPDTAINPSVLPSLAFSSKSSCLATLTDENMAIRVWDLDLDVLLADARRDRSIRYTSAKIVLVGESNVGKSCLAMRLAEDRYPNDSEQGTTHGMRFWPIEAEKLHPAAKPPEGQRRDVVLWDFGGQKEYRLVHQMFLRDTTLALVLIDPTRGREAFDQARDWNKRLEKHLGERQGVKLLVGAKIDDDKTSGLINRGAIAALCEECGFAGFYETSAMTGREIGSFRDALAGALDWDNLTKTSRPELFQRIRDDIEQRRKRGDIVTFMDELYRRFATKKGFPGKSCPKGNERDDGLERKTRNRFREFREASVATVTDQLATQGILVRTKMTGGDDAIVLQLPVIESYAASLIVSARDNPRGVPALEASELGSPSISLPGLTSEDRVSRSQERIVLEAVAELMIEHGLCFRHEGLLVFPTLLQTTESDRADELPGSVSLYYDFSGAIDNVYASLISWLVIGQGFGRVRLWENRVEFEAEDQGACGLRRVNRGSGFAHLDVYFHDGTPTETQTEFITFVHQHLRSSGIGVVEHFELICANNDCRYEIPRVVVQNRMARGEPDVMCPQCETRIKLSEGFRKERQRDALAERKTFALLTRVREDVPKIVASVKERAFGRDDEDYRIDRPIRILHLSDLHFTADIVAETKMQWLDDDIRKGKWLEGGKLDYVVISGDMTHQGSEQGFLRASEFVSLLVERFGLSAERFVFVPGNHDVQDLDEAYQLRMNPAGDERQRAVELKEQGVFLVPDPEKYPRRLKAFSDHFYHPVLQKPYPLDPQRQGVAYIFPETKLQFLTLNSCWEIDQFHRTRASVHPDALARLIAEADRQIQQAIVNTDMKPEDYLRIGVWHHPVADVERGIRNREFLGNLQNNRVRVCLTGDVHEMRRDLIDYWHEERMHVIGAGSFGAKGTDLSEGSSRLYNLLEIDREFRSIRVYTRQQPKPDGPWKGWNEWPMPGGGEGGMPYFDIPLT